MRIAEVAERSGFPPATLRYYEQVDLLPAPERTAAGYRTYDESVLGRLAFIGRAKALGCSLEEVADLLPDWDGGRCAPVQDRLREVAQARMDDVRRRVGDLEAFAADLRGIVAGLGVHTPDGPCDDGCGCVGHPVPAVACNLEAAELPGRIQAWRDLVAHVVARTPVEGGTRLQLDAATPLDQLATLMWAEQSCCSFFAFALTVDGRGAALEVRAPAEGLAMVDALFSSADW
ncbi:MAG: MerR family transcriptional regulator [Acidimicrobiales bacterium]